MQTPEGRLLEQHIELQKRCVELERENVRLLEALTEMRDMIKAMNFGDTFPRITRTLKSADDIMSNDRRAGL